MIPTTIPAARRTAFADAMWAMYEAQHTHTTTYGIRCEVCCDKGYYTNEYGTRIPCDCKSTASDNRTHGTRKGSGRPAKHTHGQPYRASKRTVAPVQTVRPHEKLVAPKPVFTFTVNVASAPKPILSDTETWCETFIPLTKGAVVEHIADGHLGIVSQFYYSSVVDEWAVMVDVNGTSRKWFCFEIRTVNVPTPEPVAAPVKVALERGVAAACDKPMRRLPAAGSLTRVGPYRM